ncbi:MAG: hypothetical protein HQL77_00785 [Magnetococcales bacterium]|nr:hypothetical protein [Magnetococcales bacterium]
MGTNRITVINWYTSDNYRIESMSFANGTVWDQATLHNLGLSIYGTAAADTLVGIRASCREYLIE